MFTLQPSIQLREYRLHHTLRDCFEVCFCFVDKQEETPLSDLHGSGSPLEWL